MIAKWKLVKDLKQADKVYTDAGNVYTVRGCWTDTMKRTSTIQFYDKTKDDYSAGKSIKLPMSQRVTLQ